VVVEVRVVKIYVIVVETFKEKERHGEIQQTINFDSFLSFTPH